MEHFADIALWIVETIVALAGLMILITWSFMASTNEYTNAGNFKTGEQIGFILSWVVFFLLCTHIGVTWPW